MFPVCLDNIKVWRTRVRERMMRMFLAFKVKVRFRLRFERKYGKNQDERLRKYAMRNMTANAAFMQDIIV